MVGLRKLNRSPSNSASQVSKADEHNISLKDNSNELSQISSNDETSLNNNIKLNKVSHLHAGCNIIKR